MSDDQFLALLSVMAIDRSLWPVDDEAYGQIKVWAGMEAGKRGCLDLYYRTMRHQCSALR